MSAKSTLWFVACVLQKHNVASISTTQTVSWKQDCSEDEARGAAVTFALKELPGWSVAIVTSAKIEVAIAE